LLVACAVPPRWVLHLLPPLLRLWPPLVLMHLRLLLSLCLRLPLLEVGLEISSLSCVI